MTTGLFESSATFRKQTVAKAAFVLLGLLDLVLTAVAMNLGLTELNPVIRFALEVPVLLMIIKFLIPLIIAWLMPGKLLVPSIALLALVVTWNIKELLVFLV